MFLIYIVSRTLSISVDHLVKVSSVEKERLGVGIYVINVFGISYNRNKNVY